MRVLRSGSTASGTDGRGGRRIHDDAIREALVVLREASDRICGKRLKALNTRPAVVSSVTRVRCSVSQYDLAALLRSRLMIDLNSKQPGPYVRSQVIPAGMSVTKAAETIGVGRPALSTS